MLSCKEDVKLHGLETFIRMRLLHFPKFFNFFILTNLGTAKAISTLNNTTWPRGTNLSFNKRILCFGDSLTQGYISRDEPFHPYTYKLSELLNVNRSDNGPHYFVYNVGLRRECVTTNMTDRLPGIINGTVPIDLVVILGGTNDLGETRCPYNEDLFMALKDLHEACHAFNIRTVAVTIPEANNEDKPYRAQNHELWLSVNQNLRDYANRHQNFVILCDLAEQLPFESLDDNLKKEIWYDNTHFTAKGYDKMGEIIYECIKDKI